MDAYAVFYRLILIKMCLYKLLSIINNKGMQMKSKAGSFSFIRLTKILKDWQWLALTSEK